MWQKAVHRCHPYVVKGRCRPYRCKGIAEGLANRKSLDCLWRTTGLGMPTQICLNSSVAHPLVVENLKTTPAFRQKNAPSRLKLLMDFFDISKSNASRLAESDSRLHECNTFNLLRNITTLKENNVNPEEVRQYLELLYFCPLTVEHQIAILQELGLVNLSAMHYRKFSKIYKSSLQFAKVHGLLPENYDVRWNVLAPLGVPDEIIRSIDIKHSNKATLGQVHKTLSLAYLCWRLDSSEDQIKKIQKVYPSTRIKSMKLQDKVFEKLKNDWDFTASKVLRHGYLLTGSPTNLDLLRDSVKDIAGADVKEASRLAPRILNVPYHSLLYISQILKSTEVESNAILSLPQICTLNPETILERISLLKKIPEFEALRSHPRMLRLIYYNTKIKTRLDLLQQLKDPKTVPSLNILSGDTAQFNRYMTLGDLKQNSRDIITFLSKNYKVKPSAIRSALKSRPGQSQSTVVSVKQNLQRLLAEGYSQVQVYEALDLVLYPPEILNEQLSCLPYRPEVQPFSEYESTAKALQLLLYFVGKEVSHSI